MLKLYRRGQVRGIDFSLAMIIFLLTMAQIMVLTGTFISNSRDFQSTSVSQQNTENYGSQILTNTGGTTVSENWATIPTSSLSSGWKFGLANNQSEVDPYKVARLADSNHFDYALNYSYIKQGLNFTEDFKIKLVNTINVTITTISLSGNDLNISGVITQKGSLVDTAELWLFVYDLNDGISQFYTIVTSGSFSYLVTPNDPTTDAFVVTAIARTGSGNQDLDYQIFTKSGGTTPSVNTQSLLPATDITSGNKIQILSTNQGGTASYASFFISDQVTNTSQASGPVNTGNGWSIDVAIPPTGIVGLLSHEVVAGVHWIGFSVFPTLLDDDVSQSVHPTTIPNSQSTASQYTFVVRGVLMEMIFTTWEK